MIDFYTINTLKKIFSMKYLDGFGISTVPVTEACYNLFKLRISFHLHDYQYEGYQSCFSHMISSIETAQAPAVLTCNKSAVLVYS